VCFVRVFCVSEKREKEKGKLLDMESELYLQHISCRSGDMDGNESENFVFAHISCRWIWTGKRKVIVK